MDLKEALLKLNFNHVGVVSSPNSFFVTEIMEATHELVKVFHKKEQAKNNSVIGALDLPVSFYIFNFGIYLETKLKKFKELESGDFDSAQLLIFDRPVENEDIFNQISTDKVKEKLQNTPSIWHLSSAAHFKKLKKRGIMLDFIIYEKRNKLMILYSKELGKPVYKLK